MKNTKQQKQCKWRMSAVSALIYYIYIYTQREFWDYIIPINLMWLVVWCLVFILNAKSELRHSLKLTHTYINKNLSPPMALQWRHNERDGVSNHQPQECLRNRFFRRRSKKHQSSASLAFLRGIHRWPVNSPHKVQVTRKTFPFDDAIIYKGFLALIQKHHQNL